VYGSVSISDRKADHGAGAALSLSAVPRVELSLWVTAAATLVCLLGATVLLLGWGADIPQVRELIPSLPGMAISTSLGFVFCGGALLAEKHSAIRGGQALQTALAGTALAFALINLLLLALGFPGVDQLLFSFPDARSESYMSPSASICLLLAAACLLLSRHGERSLSRELFACLAGTGLFIAGLSLVGHVFDSEALRSVLFFGAMGFNTTFGYLLLFPALLLSRPDWGFMSIFTGPGLGSAMLRRTLPFALLGPPFFCWLSLIAVEAGLFEVNFRLSVLATTMSIMLIALFCWAALRENAAAGHLVESNERLRQALSDRDILLKEVYHRVKNNIQFIDAMLALEGKEFETRGLGRRLAEIRGRLQAMALVHQQLVASQDLASVNLATFLEELCDNMARGAGMDARGIAIRLDAAPLRIHLEQAVPLGLIVSELISNAIKYAFPEGQGGEIQVSAQALEDEGIRLLVSDNGVGRNPEEGSSEGIGRMIIHSLSSQLGATVREGNDAGFSVELVIPREAA